MGEAHVLLAVLVEPGQRLPRVSNFQKQTKGPSP